MDELVKAVVVFLLPLYNIFLPDERVFWLYFVAAYLIGLGVYLRARKTWSLAAAIGCVKQLFPKRVLTHRSAIADYKMLFINNFGYFYLFPLVIVSSTFVAAATAGALGAVSGSASLGLAPSTASRVALTIFWLLAWDLGFFVAHYLQHKVPVLWEFHKVHHSAQVLTPITVFRMHPVDDLVTISTVGALVGIVEGVFRFLFADPVTYYMVNGLNVAWFLFLVAGYHLRHSHIWVMYPKGIREVISSPALHLIHHSANPKHFDKNFARIFVFWDRLAGTLYLPKEREEITFGMGGEEREFDSLWNIYTLPFRKVAARYFSRQAA